MTIKRSDHRVFRKFAIALICSAVAAPLLLPSIVQGSPLVERAVWNTFGTYSPTLTITPTPFGRYLALEVGSLSLVGFPAADKVVSTVFWLEVKKAAPYLATTTIDSETMRQQFLCHLFLAGKNPRQQTWNIDVRRLPASPIAQLISLCNYPLLSEN